MKVAMASDVIEDILISRFSLHNIFLQSECKEMKTVHSFGLHIESENIDQLSIQLNSTK